MFEEGRRGGKGGEEEEGKGREKLGGLFQIKLKRPTQFYWKNGMNESGFSF